MCKPARNCPKCHRYFEGADCPRCGKNQPGAVAPKPKEKAAAKRPNKQPRGR